MHASTGARLVLMDSDGEPQAAGRQDKGQRRVKEFHLHGLGWEWGACQARAVGHVGPGTTPAPGVLGGLQGSQHGLDSV